MPRSIRTCPAHEYEKGPGYVVEYDYNGDGTGWALPDWVEWSCPHLDGVFATEAEAQAAIDQH